MHVEDLGRSAARGAGVTFLGQITRVAMQMASVVILARLLGPTEYGLMAMVLVFIGVGEIFRDFGLSTAAIRAPSLSDAQRSNLFWINTAIGAGLAVTMALLAPAVGMLFDRDDVVPVARAAAVVFLINGLGTQLRADLVRRMRFGALAGIDVGAQVVAIAVAVVLADAGAGVWALVALQVSQALALLAGCAALVRWVPRLPRRGVPMREFWSFGWNLAASQIVVYVGNNVDKIVIGSWLGAVQLGLYDRGYKLVMTPVAQVRSPTTTVALPVLSRLLTQPERFQRYVARGQLALAYPVMLGAALLVGTAGPATAVLLGDGWAGVEPLVRLFATAALMQTLAYVGYWVYLACGLSSLLLRFTLVTITVKVALVLIGAQWGVVGVVVGYTVAHTIEWPLSIAWLARHAPIPARRLTLGALRILAVGAVVAGAAHLASGAIDAGVWPTLLVGLGAGSVAFGLLVALVRPVRRDAADIRQVGAAFVRRKRES